ncbi:uncharacterized protein LOC129717320 [Wyeomyia smithii]|uniref:uncharacterized protein LOC129717320 n=1 Tax=Wyeomyia smithii TaxID=174621 RepID=UPI002467CEDC|nr:uncharacterized protein LOC129717320 [Wyeomyia smithii]
MAIKRMEALERKLSKNPGLKQNVDRQIDEYVAKGYAHKITAEEQQNSDAASVWKIRLVWDAAASVNGISLNSELLAGPDMLTSLPAVIQRFREKRFSFGGDIKEMYHQLRIRPEDKQAQRFLYRKEKGPIQIFVMDVATFGSTCSPYAAAAIVNKHYVDDYLDSADSAVEAIERARQVKLIHARGGFEIGKWVSNSEEFLRALGEQNDDQAVHLHQDKMTQKERVLGIIWDSKEDVFSFSATPRADLGQMFSSGDRPTKRSVLSCVMSMFDPLGLLCPFTIIGRILVQDLWRAGCEWDELIDDEAYSKWKQWIGLLPEVGAIKVPRCYFGDATSDKFRGLQLHIFTDASEKAYGCAAYFRIVIDGEARCALVMSKSKVAPLKQLTIPRLELQAAVLGARLAQSIKCSHNLVIRN